MLSIALCTLPDSLLISMHASLSAVTTSCMHFVVSDRPAPIVACACSQHSRPPVFAPSFCCVWHGQTFSDLCYAQEGMLLYLETGMLLVDLVSDAKRQ